MITPGHGLMQNNRRASSEEATVSNPSAQDSFYFIILSCLRFTLLVPQFSSLLWRGVCNFYLLPQDVTNTV